MELNQTPVRTSKNYGINSINIEKNAFFAQKIENMAQNSLIFNNYTISGNNCFETSNDAKTLNSNILNEELSSEINQKCNFNANINFLKNEHLYKMFVNKFLYYKLIKSLYNNYINLDY